MIRLMQNNGHTLNKEGWETLAKILFEISSESGKAANVGFSCLDMIFTDYLHDIPIETIETLIGVIENFKKVSCKYEFLHSTYLFSQIFSNYKKNIS